MVKNLHKNVLKVFFHSQKKVTEEEKEIQRVSKV